MYPYIISYAHILFWEKYFNIHSAENVMYNWFRFDPFNKTLFANENLKCYGFTALLFEYFQKNMVIDIRQIVFFE